MAARPSLLAHNEYLPVLAWWLAPDLCVLIDPSVLSGIYAVEAQLSAVSRQFGVRPRGQFARRLAVSA